jgi:hypothetical protein
VGDRKRAPISRIRRYLPAARAEDEIAAPATPQLVPTLASEHLPQTHAAPSIKQQLAAVWILFDRLLIGQMVPAKSCLASARPEAYRGKARRRFWTAANDEN